MSRLVHALWQDRASLPFYTKESVVINPTQLKKGDTLILWGGEDISPSYYNQTPNKYMAGLYKKSQRDILEFALTARAIELEIPIIGICRGAQLLSIITGGKLLQHIEGHRQSHKVHTEDGHILTTNSCHHQMMMPTKENNILAWAEETTGYDENNRKVTPLIVPEIVHFPKIKSLGIQGHIEWDSMPKTYFNYCKELIKTLLL